jgi:hypothetical protein
MKEHETYLKLKYNFNYNFESEKVEDGLAPLLELYKKNPEVALFTLQNVVIDCRIYMLGCYPNWIETIHENSINGDPLVNLNTIKDFDHAIFRTFAEYHIKKDIIKSQINFWLILADEIFGE